VSLPVGVVSKTVEFGPFTDFWGAPLAGSVSFTPSRSLVWSATGQPLYGTTKTVPLDGAGSGTVSLLATDQEGFQDGAGNAVANWTYTAAVALTGSTNPLPKSISVPEAASSPIDLDLVIPVPSSTGTTVSTPIIVTSVAGLTGDVDAEDLAAELDPFITGASSGGGAVSSVNGATGVVVLDADDVGAVALTGNQTISGVKTFASAPVVPDAALAIAKTSGLQAALDAKAATSTVVAVSGAQTVAGVKTFSSAPVVPNDSFTIAKTTGLQTALDDAQNDISDLDNRVDDLETGKLDVNVRVWTGTAGTGTWATRPSVPAGFPVMAYSVLDEDAPPPPDAVAGDLWFTHPDAV
jgi:hypothetical protein